MSKKREFLAQVVSRNGLFGVLFVTALGTVIAPNWFDPLSFLITIGGTLIAAVIQTSWADVVMAFLTMREELLREDHESPLHRARYLLDLSHRAKVKGVVTLDQEAGRVSDPFTKLALELVADGQSEEDIRRILETERELAHARASRSVEVFESLGAYAPSLGLIGTVIGLVQMMHLLGDPTAMGGAMAVALLTTLYGAVVANVFCFPVAGRLKRYLTEMATIKSMTIESIISIRRQENSVVLEQRLKGFMPALVA